LRVLARDNSDTLAKQAATSPLTIAFDISILADMNEVGQHIRSLRKRRGWTLKQLSTHCNLSVSFLSQVERGLSSVSLSSLDVICRALGSTVADFFHDYGGSQSTDVNVSTDSSKVIKTAQQSVVNISTASIKYRFLSRDFPGRQLEILIGEISPGYYYPPAAHEGEEFGFVLEGRLKLKIGQHTYSLEPGDSYHFMATTPHGYEAEGEEVVKILWVQTLKYLQVRNGLRMRDSANEEETVPT